MNLSWHIAKKDLRRFWAPILAVCMITALRLTVGVCLIRSDGSDPDYFGRMAIYADVMWGIGLFLTYMLVGAVVHEDSVASEAFWQTRPISGARLLAGKSLGLFLMFGLLPVALLVPWWLGCGFGWSEIWRAALETLAVQLGVVLLALPWSVVTRDDGRFLLWTVVVAVAFATAFLVLVDKSKVVQTEVMPWFGMARLVTVMLLAAVGSVCVAIHQFLTRRTITSVIVILATAALIISTARLEKWGGSRLWLPKITAPAGVARDVTVSFERSWEWSSTLGFGVGEVQLGAKLVPPVHVLLPLYSEQRLKWGDGSISDSQARFEPWGTIYASEFAAGLLHLVPEPPNQDWLEYEMRHSLMQRKIWDPNGAGKLYTSFAMSLSPKTMTRLTGEKPEYDATAWFRLLQPEIVGEKEARVGSEFYAGARASRLVAVENDQERKDLSLSFIELSPEFLWADLQRTMNLAPWRIHPTYFLINKGRTVATEGTNSSRAGALIGEVSIVLRKDGYRSRSRWNPSKHIWEKQKGGFEGATLADVNFREVERFSVPIKGSFPLRSIHPNAESSNQKGRYSVSGEVSRAGDFDIGPGENLVLALRTAGGVSDRADLRRVELRHASADGSSSTEIVDLEAWLESDSLNFDTIPVMRPGDAIFVPEMSVGHSP